MHYDPHDAIFACKLSQLGIRKCIKKCAFILVQLFCKFPSVHLSLINDYMSDCVVFCYLQTRPMIIDDVCEGVPKTEVDLYEIVPKTVSQFEEDMCEEASKTENIYVTVPTIENLCHTVSNHDENRYEIVPKYEKDLCEIISTTREVLYEVVSDKEDNLSEIHSKLMLKSEKDLCDYTLPKGFEVKPSCLGDNVMGVFALLQIENNTLFGPYIGERLELCDQQRAFKSEHCWLVINKLTNIL